VALNSGVELADLPAEVPTQAPTGNRPAIKVGDTVWVEATVVGFWLPDPPAMPAGYQLRFSARTGSSYRRICQDIVVPTIMVRPAAG
jgi:hypothetical protein